MAIGRLIKLNFIIIIIISLFIIDGQGLLHIYDHHFGYNTRRTYMRVGGDITRLTVYIDNNRKDLFPLRIKIGPKSKLIINTNNQQDLFKDFLNFINGRITDMRNRFAIEKSLIEDLEKLIFNQYKQILDFRNLKIESTTNNVYEYEYRFFELAKTINWYFGNIEDGFPFTKEIEGLKRLINQNNQERITNEFKSIFKFRNLTNEYENNDRVSVNKGCSVGFLIGERSELIINISNYNEVLLQLIGETNRGNFLRNLSLNNSVEILNETNVTRELLIQIHK